MAEHRVDAYHELNVHWLAALGHFDSLIQLPYGYGLSGTHLECPIKALFLKPWYTRHVYTSAILEQQCLVVFCLGLSQVGLLLYSI